ncbi:MAG TPA: N-acetylmuramoyl-L-alanine amidase [Gemmatimonadales bacterium]|nr:N-acetylmuramoyl-L-alanine amidase [Gemmatimonadales bacterium]
MRPVALLLASVVTGCAAHPPRAGTAPVPAGATELPTLVVPSRDSLRVSVVYPAASDVIQSRDSVFLFGAVHGANGPPSVSIDGRPVPVRADGGWIAWLPLPADTVARFQIVARDGPDSATRLVTARVAPWFQPPPGRNAWVDTTSFLPAGRVALPAGEGIPLRVDAAPGAAVRLVLPWGMSIALVPDSLPAEPPRGVRAFAIDTPAYRPPAPAAPAGRYVGWLPAAALCVDGHTACATLVVAAGGDSAVARWPLSVSPLDLTFPTVVTLNHDTAEIGTTDSITPGRAVPHGTYNWFFPQGTVAVLSGRWNDQARLQLSRGVVAWVNAADVVPLAAGTPPPGGVVGPVRLTPGRGSLTLRVPLPARLPFLVSERERKLTLRLYGGASDINWMQYGGTDPLVTHLSYAQPAADEVTVTVELARDVWGYRTRFDGRDLLLEIRRPPAIDPRHPLKGRTIVLDPGHPPLGATGPTGLWEPVATLAVALKAKTLLERGGATVLLTRADATPLELYPRIRFAESHDADLLVSIHANALPDGINPFTNTGTSVYYFQPRSARLARELDRALVAELGVRDLGMGRGDYALVRPTWMPAALTEGLFIILPDQEAMLASDEGQWRYARGVAKGIENFLRDRAREPR